MAPLAGFSSFSAFFDVQEFVLGEGGGGKLLSPPPSKKIMVKPQRGRVFCGLILKVRFLFSLSSSAENTQRLTGLKTAVIQSGEKNVVV